MYHSGLGGLQENKTEAARLFSCGLGLGTGLGNGNAGDNVDTATTAAQLNRRSSSTSSGDGDAGDMRCRDGGGIFRGEAMHR